MGIPVKQFDISNLKSICRKASLFLETGIGNALLGAILVASVIVCLKSFHMLDRIKVATLSSITAVRALSDAEAVPSKIEKDLTKIIINQALYEDVFNQSSPLDRKELTALFKKLAEFKPAVVAVDLDLSPNPTEQDNDLFEQIINMATTCCPPIKVVLIVPEPVRPSLLDRKCRADQDGELAGNFNEKQSALCTKYNWMQELLNNGVNFGMSSIYTLDGMALKYFNAPFSLAGMACKAKYPQEMCKPGHEPHGQPEKAYIDLLTQVDLNKNRQATKLLLNRTWRNHLDESFILENYLTPFNLEFLDHHQSNTIYPIKDENTGSLTIPEEYRDQIEGKIVFVGGDYGITDYYKTAVGSMPGIDLHFGALYSMLFPVEGDEYWWPYLLEIFFGFWIGLAVHWLLHFHQKHPHIVLRFIILSAVLLILLLLALLSYLLLKHFNFWINPAPLFIGILIHNLVAFLMGEKKSEHGIVAHTDNLQASTGLPPDTNPEREHGKASLYQRSDKPLSYLMYLLIVGYALNYLSSHAPFWVL